MFAIKDAASLPHAAKPPCNHIESVTRLLLTSLIQIYSKKPACGAETKYKVYSLERAKEELGSLILQFRHVLKERLPWLK